jgi:HEAT repeat protein
MKFRNTLACAILLSCCVGTAWSQEQKTKGTPIDLQGKTLRKVFDELLPGMGAADIGARRTPQQRWQEICVQTGAPGNEALRVEACKLMMQKLGAETPTPARVWLLKQLERIGRAECVDAVAAIVNDKSAEVSDGAIRCLAANQSSGATAALIACLRGADIKARVGIMNALGYRRDPFAVEALKKQYLSANADVIRAAAGALGQIGTVEAIAELSRAHKAPGPIGTSATDALLLCADRLVIAGQLKKAAAIYEELSGKDERRPVRLAALEGRRNTAGDKAGEIVVAMLNGTDRDARNIAIGSIEGLSPGALKVVAASLEKLPEANQVMVLTALASRGDSSQRPIALAAAQSKKDAIRRAGLRALGRLGDASVVSLLIDTLRTNRALADVARESLSQVPGEGVNEKIIDAVEATKSAEGRAELITILQTRKATAAVPALLKQAQDLDSLVRSRAMAALGQLAEAKDLPEMAPALLKTNQGKEREDAERAIVAVCARIANAAKRAEPVLVIYQSRGASDKAILLPLLGRLGERKVLEPIRAAIIANNPALRDAAVLSLCNWPDRSVNQDLLKLAEGASVADHRKLALRALVRVNSLPGEGSNGEKLVVLKKAMDLATTVEDRRMVLQGLAAVKDIETLRYVVTYLDNKDLVQQACRTVVDLGHSKTLRGPNQEEFNRALDRVIRLCRDQSLIERAQRYKQGF